MNRAIDANRFVARSARSARAAAGSPAEERLRAAYTYLLDWCEDCVAFFERASVRAALRIASGLFALAGGYAYACALMDGRLTVAGILIYGAAFVCAGVFAIRGKSGL